MAECVQMAENVLLDMLTDCLIFLHGSEPETDCMAPSEAF